MALTAEISRTNTGSGRGIFYSLAVSVVLHLLFVFFLGRTEAVMTSPKEQLIEVSLQAPPEKPKPALQEPIPAPPPKQMISPPDLPEVVKPPENTKYLSDKNTVTPKEQIKRGDGAKGTPTSKPREQQKSQQQKSQQQNFQSAEEKEITSEKKIETARLDPKKILNLKLDPDSLNELAEKPRESKSGIRNLSRYQPFTKDGGANGELFRFRPGVPDFLPNIPDGELTLLNAKADKFAPFVRRVASQVFGIVRKLQWHNIPASDVMRISDFTTIEAVLSPQGKLLKVTIQEGSGSASFDKVITQSVREGANDQNPPAGVQAEDGNIHFIFKSRCWTRPGAAGIPDSRWLLLATGLL